MALFDAGLSIAATERQLGLRERAFYDELRRAGIPTRRDRHVPPRACKRCSETFTPDTLQRTLCTDCAAERTSRCTKCGKRIHRVASTCRACVQAEPSWVEEARALYEGGETLREIAQRFGVSGATVRSKLRAAGTDWRERSAARVDRARENLAIRIDEYLCGGSVDEQFRPVLEWLREERHSIPTASEVLKWQGNGLARVVLPWERSDNPPTAASVRKLADALGRVRARGWDSTQWADHFEHQSREYVYRSWWSRASAREIMREGIGTISPSPVAAELAYQISARGVNLRQVCIECDITFDTLKGLMRPGGQAASNSTLHRRELVWRLCTFLAGPSATLEMIEAKVVGVLSRAGLRPPHKAGLIVMRHQARLKLPRSELSRIAAITPATLDHVCETGLVEERVLSGLCAALSLDQAERAELMCATTLVAPRYVRSRASRRKTLTRRHNAEAGRQTIVSYTEQRIRDAVTRLRETGERVSINSVATVSGCNWSTVKSHKELLTKAL